MIVKLIQYCWVQDNLVKAVAAVNNNTIVVVNTVGPIIVDAWIENPNITGLVCPIDESHGIFSLMGCS